MKRRASAVRSVSVPIVAVALLAVACRTGGPSGPGDAGSDTDAAADCSACHGSAANAAPPVDLRGASETTERGVGAHQAHLAASDWRAAVACDACHTVPATVDAEGHIGMAPAELTWGAAASADDATPAFDGTSCAGVYCHGATLDGGSNTAPAWTTVDGTQDACGTCHGLPPGDGHPTATDCSGCHGEVVAAGGGWTDATKHIDGVVQVSGGGCDSCHGADGNPAPPPDTTGNTDTTARGVGAHRSHLAVGSTWHRDVSCHECHVSPATVDAAGHIDTPLPAELTWGPLATAEEATPAFDGTTCSGSYCHGATLDGGSIAAPAWTTVDGTQDACGACHGLPPGDDHPGSTQCERCHGEVVAAGGGWTDRTKHIDGEVQVSTSGCDSCHGADGNPAPPPDTSGNTETTARGVGAHARHLDTSDWRADVACTECHVVPATTGAAGHVDTPLPAELTWGARATTDGATPSFDGTACAGSYCHGATLDGGSIAAPAWTTVDGTQDACGACHGLPPGGGHPGSTQCERCHGEVVAAGGGWTDRTKHIDGIVQVATSCDSCHGAGGNPAPPPDTTGATTTTARGVGAHASHLATGSDWRADMACTDCHVVPAALDDAGHVDTAPPAELTWGTRARTDGASPAFDGTSCSGVYCHGATLTAGSLTAPRWTLVDGSQAACGTCHGLPPATPHPGNPSCSTCHSSVINSTFGFVAPALHVNGSVDF